MFHVPAHKQTNPDAKPGQVVNLSATRTYVEGGDPLPQPARYDVTGAIIAFEHGDLDEDDTIELFQHLINTGLAWSLQGSYGRAAVRLIEAGHCTPAR